VTFRIGDANARITPRKSAEQMLRRASRPRPLRASGRLLSWRNAGTASVVYCAAGSPGRFTPRTTIRPMMTEKLPIPCEHCSATGIFHGSECAECRGKGYRLMIDGQITTARAPAPPRGPYRNAPGRRTGEARNKFYGNAPSSRR